MIEVSNSFGVVARLKAPAGKVGRWVNVYKYEYDKPLRYQTGGAYPTRKQADAVANTRRHSCIYVHFDK